MADQDQGAIVAAEALDIAAPTRAGYHRYITVVNHTGRDILVADVSGSIQVIASIGVPSYQDQGRYVDIIVYSGDINSTIFPKGAIKGGSRITDNFVPNVTAVTHRVFMWYMDEVPYYCEAAGVTVGFPNQRDIIRNPATANHYKDIKSEFLEQLDTGGGITALTFMVNDSSKHPWESCVVEWLGTQVEVPVTTFQTGGNVLTIAICRTGVKYRTIEYDLNEIKREGFIELGPFSTLFGAKDRATLATIVGHHVDERAKRDQEEIDQRVDVEIKRQKVLIEEAAEERVLQVSRELNQWKDRYATLQIENQRIQAELKSAQAELAQQKAYIGYLVAQQQTYHQLQMANHNVRRSSLGLAQEEVKTSGAIWKAVLPFAAAGLGILIGRKL